LRFKDKVVIITGGDKGIGKSTVLALTVEGAYCVLGYFHDRKAAEEIAQLIRESGNAVELVRVDVRLKKDCERLVERAVSTFSRLDIAVNNAGVSTMNLVVDLTEGEWDFNMDVNAKRVFFCCQAQVRQFMKQGKGGKIVNVASVAAKRPARLFSHYAASKSAVLGFSKCLALEVAQQRIYVNCVCPGLVRTSMQEREIGWEAGLMEISEEQVRRNYISSVPLGRLEEPVDVAKVILFLASEDSDYMTGQAINVAGGMEMAL
jgi:meso-butanediol dehydrogenase/(S,S)-butanediol dehydrogenase/diacetyl reductase